MRTAAAIDSKGESAGVLRARRPIALSMLAAGGVLAVFSSVHASDHLDGSRATADPPADITDVFAFTSPEDPSRVVFAMAVAPYAASSARFPSGVEYAFRVRRVTAPNPLTMDPAPLDVACTFDGAVPQTVHCTAPAGMSADATVGAASSDDGAMSPMRVFAGPRSDPAFFDRQGALATVATGRAAFTGQNAFAGANVLAIVVEIDARAAFVPAREGGAGATDAAVDAGADGGPASPMPMLAVAAETTRRAN
jgi:hypothetical protein